jgi:hypothetical protein
MIIVDEKYFLPEWIQLVFRPLPQGLTAATTTRAVVRNGKWLALKDDEERHRGRPEPDCLTCISCGMPTAQLPT